jgi:hypothetical protein
VNNSLTLKERARLMAFNKFFPVITILLLESEYFCSNYSYQDTLLSFEFECIKKMALENTYQDEINILCEAASSAYLYGGRQIETVDDKGYDCLSSLFAEHIKDLNDVNALIEILEPISETINKYDMMKAASLYIKNKTQV